MSFVHGETSTFKAEELKKVEKGKSFLKCIWDFLRLFVQYWTSFATERFFSMISNIFDKVPRKTRKKIIKVTNWILNTEHFTDKDITEDTNQSENFRWSIWSLKY